jgi:hypothetical protein
MRQPRRAAVGRSASPPRACSRLETSIEIPRRGARRTPDRARGVQQRAQQQPGADQQHGGQGHLRHHEGVAQRQPAPSSPCRHRLGRIASTRLASRSARPAGDRKPGRRNRCAGGEPEDARFEDGLPRRRQREGGSDDSLNRSVDHWANSSLSTQPATAEAGSHHEVRHDVAA